MRKPRRKERTIDASSAIKILLKGEYGILSTVGDDDQPYGVPLNYVYKDNAIYVHSAVVGHKIDNIKHNPKVAFCVVGRTTILPSEISTAYESAMAFGTASEITGDEKYNALLRLLEKYTPHHMDEGKNAIKKYDKATKVIKIKVHQISGKASHIDNL